MDTFEASPQISFIMPAFNASETIENAAASVLAAKDVTLELIIVDDGSTDATGDLADALAETDQRVRVVHTQNQGQGLARNCGLNIAHGQWVAFCDADDAVLADGPRSLLEAATSLEVDIAIGCYQRIDADGVMEECGMNFGSGILKRHGSVAEQKLYHRIKTESIFGYLWNKLYRRSFLQNHHLAFPDIRTVYMEDQLFNLCVFAQNPKSCLVNKAVYAYNAQGASTTRAAEPQIAEKNAVMLAAYSEYLQSLGSNAWQENQDLFVPLAARVLCWSMFKNIPFEGVHFDALRRRAKVFLGTPCFARMLDDKKSSAQLRHLPSAAQRVFYGYSLRVIRVGQGSLLAFTFVVFAPLMARYISAAVK